MALLRSGGLHFTVAINGTRCIAESVMFNPDWPEGGNADRTRYGGEIRLLTPYVSSEDAERIVRGFAETNTDLVAVPVPRTNLQTLALAVLKGEPCGRELIDEMIGLGVIDPEAEVVMKARADERERVARQFDQLASEEDWAPEPYYHRRAAGIVRGMK